MGNCGFNHFIPNSIIGQSEGVLVTALELGYSSSDIDIMYTAFQNLDIDRKGTVSIEEFITAYKITNERFMVLTLSIFDEDKSGDINFEEFLIVCWSCLSMDENCLPRFAFRLFDEDDSGELSALEINELLKIICGNEIRSQISLNNELNRLDMNHDGLLSFNEFLTVVNQNPSLLFPAFEMRDILRKMTVGTRRWSQLAKERTRKYGDKCITIILKTFTHKSSIQNQKISFNHHLMIQRSAKATENFVQRSKKKEKSYRQQMLHDRNLEDRTHRHFRSSIHKEKGILEVAHVA